MDQDNVRMSWEAPAEVEAKGLEDGGKVILTCSNCNEPLVQLQITNPHEPRTLKVQAQCCFCGDTSFEKEITGGFYHAGAGKPHPEDEDVEIASTVVDDIEMENDTYLFITKKAKK